MNNHNNNNNNNNNIAAATTTSNNNNIIISRTNGSQACAACKYQRRKCASDCVLAPYFPHDRQRQFLNAHKLFGVSNITKIIRHLTPPEKDEAMRTIIFESDIRAMDPVGGCYRIIRQLQRQIEQSQAELDLVLHHLAYCQAQAALTTSSDGIPAEHHRPNDINSNTNNNNFGASRGDEWYEQQSNVYSHYQHQQSYHQYQQQQPQYYVVQNGDDRCGDHQQLPYGHHVDHHQMNAAWGLHARDTTPPSSAAVPTSQISNENEGGCESMKPILDLSGYVEDLNFGPEETLEESGEVIVKDQEKAAALNEEEESISSMLKIMI